MRVEIQADADKIGKELEKDFYSTYAWDMTEGSAETPEWGVDGYLEDVIDAVLKHVKFKVDGSPALVVVK